MRACGTRPSSTTTRIKTAVLTIEDLAVFSTRPLSTTIRIKTAP